jgi:hypothetical protein
VPERIPLTTLLSWTWVAFAIEADNAVEAAGAGPARRLFRISIAMWANGLRFIDDDGITVADLQARARAKCNLPGLERWRWITIGEPSSERRDGYGSSRGVTSKSVLRPTPAGAYGRALWPEVIAGTEQRWRDRFGPSAVESLRLALLPSAGQLPSAPPEVHPSDGFYSHVTDGLPNEDKSLASLLAQALTGLTLEHERGARASLPLSANFLRVLGDRTVRIRDLPRLSGVSKEAVAMAVGFLERRKMAEPRAERSITLTAVGHAALRDYQERAAHAENPALRARLDAVLRQHEALAQGLVAPDGCWRAEKPYLAQTERMLADPAAALPWHPMVLHRAGWPDGS